MGMEFASTWLRQVSPPPASQNHFNHCSEHSRLHKLTPLWTILRTHPRCVKTKVMGPKVELYCAEPCPPWSTCPASPIRWRTLLCCSFSIPKNFYQAPGLKWTLVSNMSQKIPISFQALGIWKCVILVTQAWWDWWLMSKSGIIFIIVLSFEGLSQLSEQHMYANIHKRYQNFSKNVHIG